MKRRFIAFILIVLILIPLMPKPTHAKGSVKGIDVLMNELNLQVEGKGFSHRETFIYEGDLWVPMSDLAPALGMKINFNSSSRLLYLNSNGRLNFDDKSKQPISYQRGYEIETKERLMTNINKDIKSFLDGSRESAKSKGSELKSIRVGFDNIEIKLDNKSIHLDREPLIYNDAVYVALTSLSPYLYITPKLSATTVNIDSNGILKDKPNYTLDALVQFREDLNNRYSRELAELNKKKIIIMDVKIPYEKINSVSDMEKYLNKHLGKIKDLSVDISLKSGTNNSYYIDIDFPSRNNSTWRNLTRRDVESYIWDIYVAISSLYDENVKLQGNIKNLVTFDTKMKNIVFSFIDSGLDMSTKVDPIFIQELLSKKMRSYGNFSYSARISGYDLELIITAANSDFMKSWSPWKKMDFLEDINYVIKDSYSGLKVNGKVIYDDMETFLFVIENNKVRSNTLMGTSTDYLNEKFGTLSTGRLRIPMKYSLNQTDIDNFKLIVDMDFLISDSQWDRKALDDLGSLMDEVLRFIVNMWDTNIFIQVYDKSQTLAYEYVVSQDTVQMVKASPSGGEVTEGSSITLTTSTQAASIYYTLDGSSPSEKSNLYTKPITISSNTTLRAFAVKKGFGDSPTSTFQYTVVDDSNMASGLDNLVVDGYRLDPSFNKKESNYTLVLPYGTDSINIMAKASTGSITINGKDSDKETINIDSDNITVEIVHSEPGKSKNRIYTLKISLGIQVDSNVKMGTYDFVSQYFGSFSGNLTGDYSGHSVRLLPKVGVGKIYGEVNVDSNGAFLIDGFDVDYLATLIGYKYEVVNSKGEIVDDGNL